jgi:hypothetical protein
MEPNRVIIKFEQVAEQVQGPVKRIIGFVLAKHMLGLFDAADLQANPRSAKAGSVTEEIMESIGSSADIFPFKTKGVLIGASEYEVLRRNRYELRFIDPDVEGVLDGGHNMLAIGTKILCNVIENNRELSKIKVWDDFKKAWEIWRPEVTAIKDHLDFLVPIEVLVPSELDDEEIVHEFKTSLLDICAARNNNVELTVEARANKKGFYNEIRKLLPKPVAARIEWKTNDGGQVKVRDIIALAWIPLSKLELPIDIRVSPQNIYRNKGECIRAFDRLMNDKNVSKPYNGYAHELHNTAVGSAINILSDLPELYDKIYQDFPEAYNASGGHFGRISIVKMYEPGKRREKNPKYVRTQPHTHFTQRPVRYRYPDGLIMPLVYGLRALMQVKDNKLKWVVDPKKFLDAHINEIAAAYKLVLEMSRYDPQKIGKNENSYKFALGEYEKALLKQEQLNSGGGRFQI